MKKLVLLISIVVIGLFMGIDANASHLAGGSIRYDYIGLGSTPGTYKYKVSATVIRYCRGIQYSTAALAREAFWFRCASTGTTLGPFTATLVPYVPKPGERSNARGAKDISDVCRSTQTSCELSSSSGAKGYEAFTVEYTIDLPRCNSWEVRLVTEDCCRNGVQNFTTSPGNVGLETNINTAWSPWTNPGGAPANSAPIFADEAKPMPSACTGQNVFYGVGTVDADGDSLRFALTCPWSASRGSSSATLGNPFVNMVNNAPISPYTCAKPIDNLVLDSATGLISFRTNVSNQYIVAFYVYEYERCTGILKGKTYREVQFTVDPCSNNVPRDISGIANLQGNAQKLGKYSLEVCEGEIISWEDTIYDSDVLDTLYFASNVDSVLEGVTFTQQSLARNKALIKFSWRAKLAEGQYKTFFVAFDDDRCDFPGNGYSIFEIIVRPAASAGPDQYVCKGDTSRLDALGGSSFVWHVISGDPIVNGVNWFPDTTANDTARTVTFLPTQTTRLWVEVDTLKDACGNLTIANCFTTDTIEIFVPDSFSVTPSPDFFLCNPGLGKLDVTPSQPTFTYSYQWEPSKYLDNDTLKSPNFTGVNVPVTFDVTVTSDGGCVRETSVDVNVTEPFPTNMELKASDTLICLGKVIDLWVDKGTIDYGAGRSCDTAVYRCQGEFKDFTVGAGALTNPTTGTNYPATFATNAYSVKNQYLYLASDLKAMGLQAGPINAISWEITGLNNGAPINGFTIKIGCTAMIDLPQTGFVLGLKTIRSATSIFPGMGWNKFSFDDEYVWDGVSNIIIEMCWDNGNTRQTSHQIQTFDNTTYRSAKSYFQTSTFTASACGSATTTGGAKSSLPRTRFSGCSGMRSSLFKFDWDPKATGNFVGPTNEALVKANTNLSTASKYYVYIEDSAYGVCFDTLEIDINVVSQYDVTPYPVTPRCFQNGFVKLESNTPWNISVPGGRWTGAGIINDTLGIWDPIKSGFGKFAFTYSVTGDACAASATDTIEIVGLPNTGILGPDSLCELYGGAGYTVQHKLIPIVDGGWFSGVGVDSAMIAGKMTYWIDGTKFNPTTGSPDYANVTYTLFDGCLDDSTFRIPVIAQWDSTFRGTLDNGTVYATKEFCMTSDYLDTLAVAGDNPTWSFASNPAAMIDPSLGVFSAKDASAGKTEDFLDKIVVSNNGFCGTSNSIDVIFVRAPEVEVIDKVFCYDWIKDPANKFLLDTVEIRIPKGTLFPGHGSVKSLGTPGNDTIVSYGGIASTGWANAYDGVGDQYTYNYWDGKPWMTFPNIAKFRPASMQPGSSNFIIYQFAISYRGNHPNKNLCYSRDTGAVYIRDEVTEPSSPEYAFCEDEFDSLGVDPVYGADYELFWWTDISAGSLPIDSMTAVDTLVYNDAYGLDLTNGRKTIYARYRDNFGCWSTGYGPITYNMVSYPDVKMSSTDTSALYEGTSVTFTNVTEYSDTGITYEWRYDNFDNGSYVDAVVPHEIGDENSSIKVNYGLYGRPCTELWGINDAGCADSIEWCVGVEKSVRLSWPNVFTPGNDGYNDWWYPLSAACVESGGNSGCFTSEDEIKEWAESSFDKFTGYIYDRWGRKVFTIDKENPVWKGENNGGGELLDGVYMYSIRWTPNGLAAEEEVAEGTITLIREK
ncbi:MAG: gliding motility-associated C-terminal domain-containing protein [Salibacteraceae bacterium]